MKKLNQLSKEAVQKGIFNYLVYRDPSIVSESISNILANNTWRRVKNVEIRRQADIAKLLEITADVNASHERLHMDVLNYLENMGKGLLGNSMLQQFIQCELEKLNAFGMDNANLELLSIIVSNVPEGEAPDFLNKISQLQEELRVAREVHRSDQSQIQSLQTQIVSLQMSMRLHQEELGKALEIIKKNQQSEKEQKIRMEALEKINSESTASINQLLALLQNKGLISHAEMKSSQIPDQAASFDSTRSLMSISP
jgi:hypothetical protein